MELIRGFCGKLRGLAVTLDLETARLQRALEGEDSDSEDYSMRTLYDLCSEVQTLKDDVTVLLDKACLESQESIDFMKATKLLMKKNSMDIMKITEYFQKYGYNLHAKKNSVDDYDINDSKVESVKHEELQNSDMKDDLSDLAAPSSSVSEKSPRSPQLSDFGLERYMISHVLPNVPQVVNNRKEEPEIITPSTKESLVTVPKTPKCVLKMDDFECITPKLEHFGISDYTLCLNDDYTIGLKNMEKNKCEQFLETELMSNDISTVSPDPIIQRLEKNAWQATCDVFDMPNTVTTSLMMETLLGPLEQIDEQQEDSDNAEYTNSPLAPTFCTPGLKIPSTKNSRTLMSTSYPLSETNCSSDELEMKDCISLVFSSDECFKNFTAPSSPKISSCENLLQTPTPPDVTTIPEDVLQILSKYSSNLATPSAVKAVPHSKEQLTKYEKQNIRGIGNKENW